MLVTVNNDLAEEWFVFDSDGAEVVYFGALQHDGIYSAAYDGDGTVVVALDCSGISEDEFMLHLFNEMDHVEYDDADPNEMWQYGVDVQLISADSFWQRRSEMMQSENSRARFYVSCCMDTVCMLYAYCIVFYPTVAT
jgi:hypothetical protein